MLAQGFAITYKLKSICSPPEISGAAGKVSKFDGWQLAVGRCASCCFNYVNKKIFDKYKG